MKRLLSLVPALLLIMLSVLGCSESSNPFEAERTGNEPVAHPSAHEMMGSFTSFSDDFETGLDPAVWYAEYNNGAQWIHATEGDNGYIYCTAQYSPGSKRWTYIYTIREDFDNFVFTWDMRFRSQSYHKDSRAVVFRSDDYWPFPRCYLLYEGVKRPSPPYQYTDELSLAFVYYDPDLSSTSLVYMSHPWILYQWYSFKLEAEENVFRLKVWVKGDMEPEGWTFETVDPDETYSSGRIGFGNYWFGVTDVDNVSVAPLVRMVEFDIKPRSCPNPLNVKLFDMEPLKNPKAMKKGVLPVAILGTDDFDVHDIDISTIKLEGVAPLRHNYEDVATPALNGEECDCVTSEPDGYIDLALKFMKMDIVSVSRLRSVSVGDVIPLEISGMLLDGTPFVGKDCVWIVGKEPELEPELAPF